MDPNSFSEPDLCICKHLHFNIEVLFEKKVLHGSLRLQAVNKSSNNNRLILDTNKLKILSVSDAKTGHHMQWEVQPMNSKSPFGSALVITLPSSSSRDGEAVDLEVLYETSPEASAVQWLAAEQTVGKTHPYLFTQCQAIHARSMFPCQDTPSVKTTYSAEVIVPGELTALMSAIPTGNHVVSGNDKSSRKVFTFEQKVPIPSYLVALAVGALESRQIGARSSVWSEKEVVDSAAYEFAHTEDMLNVAEGICGPYVWEKYDLLVLPPSFPYGGMENPCLTFVTPTVLAGDRSLVNVVAHELSHSWTGNLVTNHTWEHFWLNEGFTVFVERKIMGRMFDEKMRHFHCIGGWKALVNSVNDFKDAIHLTSLVPNLEGIDPDDAFSSVPYEKGSALLFYLECLVGDHDQFELYLRSYIETFKYKTVTTDQWKHHFLTYFHKQAEQGVFSEVDWDGWLFGHGLPPCKPAYNTAGVDACTDLCQKWIAASDEQLDSFSPEDIKDFNSHHLIEFLSLLLLEKPPVDIAKVKTMQCAYNLHSYKNAEIRFRWLRLCVKAGWEDVFSMAVTFVSEQGRMKFVRPLYRDLYAHEKSRALALSTFHSLKPLYHHITANMLEKDLDLRQ
ncbi:leukotriene A-4 hydrolase-like [Corticium candelabrum]|uniref:leukotriene A-4 hydrolase-like n=1 Tax=Corticium candelabrum TaxID=121492 RepID=UPI002E26BB09|nr:leukotriene A-4 hydrolase-like [Corticium candelabrum]